jgi:protein TonB
MQHEAGEKGWAEWLPSLALVIALHAAVWWGFTRLKAETTLPKPLPTVQVSLVSPSVPEPPVAPTPPDPPKPKEPPKPQPIQKPVPVPRPLPVAERSPEPVQEDVAAPVAAAPVAPPPPAPAAAPAPQPAAEPVVEPPQYKAAYLSNPRPQYPLAARRRGIEGTVLIRAEISTAGECLRAEIRKGSGYEMLDHAALEAVKKWRFVPAKRGSQAIVAWVEVPITFKLEEN